MSLRDWLGQYVHFHTWAKWQTTREFRRSDYSEFESEPSEDDVKKFGRPVMDQKRTCEGCGAVQFQRIYG